MVNLAMITVLILLSCLILYGTGNVVVSALSGGSGGGGAHDANGGNHKPEEGYLFRGDPDAEAVVIEYHVAADHRGDLDANVGVDRVVDFYDPYCGACQRFAPKYVKLATEAKSTITTSSSPAGLSPNTQFHSVSCRRHPALCSSYGIRGYPTLMVLPSGASGSDDAITVSRDIVGGVGGGGLYSLTSIGKAMDKARANLDSDRDHVEGGDADADATAGGDEEVVRIGRTRRRLEDEEMGDRDGENDDDDLSGDAEVGGFGGEGGGEDDEVTQEEDDGDDDEASPDDGDEWEKMEGPPPRPAGRAGARAGARPLPASKTIRRPETPVRGGRGRPKKLPPAAAAAANVARRAADEESFDEDNEDREAEGEEVTSPDVDDSLEDAAAAAAAQGAEFDDSEEDEDERPLTAVQKRANAVNAKNRMARMKKDLDDNESSDGDDGSENDEEDTEEEDSDEDEARAATTFGRNAARGQQRGDISDEDESRERPAAVRRPPRTAAKGRGAKTTTVRKIPAALAERGADSDEDDKAETPTSPKKPPISVRKFATLKKESDEDEDESAEEADDDEEASSGANDDDDEEASSGANDDDDDEASAGGADDDEASDDDAEASTDDSEDPPLAGRPPPGQVRVGASPLYQASLAKTGMQPKDIERYQKAAAERRAELAKKAQKRIPPVFQGKKAAAARREAAKALKRTPAQVEQLKKERQQKNKELREKRVEITKRIRERKRLAAVNGGTTATSERVRAQGGPAFAEKKPWLRNKENTIGKKKSIPEKVLSKVPVVKRAFKTMPEEDLYGDAALSFVTGLKMGVYSDSRPLDEKRQKALLDWLQLLSISLPPELGLHALIDDLLNNMSYITQGRDKLYEQLDKYPLANKFWSDSCSKGRKGQGQNCGLWKLLHIVTVGFAEQRGGLEHLDSAINVPISAGPAFTPNEGAAIIREYIALFFGCDVCKNNFLSKYDDCISFGRCDRMPVDAVIDEVKNEDWEEFPLWLWEFHNHISARIVQVKAKRDGGRDDEVIGIWPGTETCFSCYNIDGSWNMEELYAFLEKTYWYGSTVDFQADRALHEYERSQRSTSSGDGAGFGTYAFFGAVAFALYASKKRKVWMSDMQKNFGTSIPFPRNGYSPAGKKA
eukprot:CAMPEP_0178649068 /NCGR_PEP_ID=MMETSP0698-20121128/20817_1 /TAXON_ID=265572 /ORGANISM="Extubocellulus spinifer, Strain CCMP396" /LENGTH=1131 /DNA_ID=CAMNT_0020290479 /DNA_START=37 /DNA_END=3432 /DNA_ORIENTATION=+